MSSRYSIRAQGVAGCYLATPTANEDGVSMVPSLVSAGFCTVSVDFSLHKEMPAMLSSLDETHWLFSYHDRYLHTEFLSIGITPVGSVVFACNGTEYEMFSPGSVAPDGTKHTAAAYFSWLSGEMTCVLDGVSRIQSIGLFDPLVPSTIAVFSALNGGNARSKFHAAVSGASAVYGYIEGTPSERQTATWAFSEGSGDSVACELSGDGTGLELFDLGLVRGWMYDYSCPWPTDFSGDAGEGAAWQLKTPYTRRTRAATRYRRRRVSWLS